MPATSPSEEANEGHDPEFKWGKKRGVGGPKKDIRFYESFTYDGIDYTLYDCVYLYKQGEPEPYIGKLVKIWEQPNHKRKIKVHWFFRPIEILNWLGGNIALEKEIFLASGEGVGLANINPLVMNLWFNSSIFDPFPSLCSWLDVLFDPSKQYLRFIMEY